MCFSDYEAHLFGVILPNTFTNSNPMLIINIDVHTDSHVFYVFLCIFDPKQIHNIWYDNSLYRLSVMKSVNFFFIQSWQSRAHRYSFVYIDMTKDQEQT